MSPTTVHWLFRSSAIVPRKLRTLTRLLPTTLSPLRLNPGSVFTVKTYESHAWRFVDSSTGYTVAEHVAAAGQQVGPAGKGLLATLACSCGTHT